MILDIDQLSGRIDISYLNKDGNKAIMQFAVPQYTQWTVDETGRGTIGHIDISGKPVIKKWAKTFRTFDLLQFLKSQPKSIQDELFAYREANLIASDIETEIGDRFPKPELADMPINAISCVDTKMNIIVYTTKQCSGNTQIQYAVNAEPNEDGAWQKTDKKTVIELANIASMSIYESYIANGYKDSDEIDWPTGEWFKWAYKTVDINAEVDKIVQTQIGHLIAPHEKIHVNLLHFDTEKQMLEAYGNNIIRFGAVITFWNGDGFDKPYIANRCRRLGINMENWSITGSIASMTGMPKHTVFTDYMFMVKEYDRRIKNRESLKLDYIAFRLLEVGKLPYRGTLKEMSENDICGFLAYNTIDSCLVQLIHRQMNLMSTLYGFSHVCKMPLAKANSQVAQTESLISLDTLNMLDTEGIDMPEKASTDLIEVAAFNPNRPARRKYDGGHVKEPHKHVAGWNACLDFSGLYPSVHRSCNLSIENYIGNINQFNAKLQKQILTDANYFVSVNKNVYKNDKTYAYKRIQIYLRAKRDYHKKHMNKFLSLQQPFIEYALWERGLWKEQAKFDASIETLPWKVSIDNIEYEPDLVRLNAKKSDGSYVYEHMFLWFLFHENLRNGFFEMNMQVSYKLVANSLYGATANDYNSFCNVDVADDTTAEGRNSIVTAEKIINNWFNYEWHADNACHAFLLDKFPGQFDKLVISEMPALPIKDRVMYIDTDSLYIEYVDIMESTGFTGDPIDLFVELYEHYLGDIVNTRLHAMINDRHGNSMQAFDLEHIARTAIFRKKKSYLKTSDWVDGRKYAYDDAFAHLKTTGFALARSFQSEKCRDAAKNAIIEIIQGKWQTPGDYLKNMTLLWQDFQTWPIEDISKRLALRKDKFEQYILGYNPVPEFAKRTLPQYRGAAWFNYQLRQRNLTDKIQDIDDGFVCFYEDVLGNHFAYRIFELPEWHPEPNKIVQFYKLIGNTIRDVAMYYNIVCPLPFGQDTETRDTDETED